MPLMGQVPEGYAASRVSFLDGVGPFEGDRDIMRAPLVAKTAPVFFFMASQVFSKCGAKSLWEA